MPGPGQGKQSHKKKWRENVSNLNANIAAVNAVMTASSTSAANTRTATLATLPSSAVTTAAVLTDETVPETSSYTATLPTKTTDTATTTANTVAVDANDASNTTRVDTATATSPTNEPFTYSHDEVQQLLEDARLDGWQEGFEEGHRTGRKSGHEEGREDGYEAGYDEGSKKWIEGHEEGYSMGRKMAERKAEEAWKRGQGEGYELGKQDGKEEERRKWLTEGHGAGLCLSMATHARELLRGAVLLDEAETQTDSITTTNVDVQTTTATSTTANADTQTDTVTTVVVDIQTPAATTTVDADTQMTLCPGQRAAATQTKPPDEEQPHTSKNIEASTSSNPTIIPDPQGSRSALLHDELVETPERKITPAPPLVPEPSRCFDWAEEAESLPIISQLPPPPRDLSALHSNIPRPFDSIPRQAQHHNQVRNPPIHSFTR
jgi:flagellar biosynthesis/type III secretory pathway protein FliH